MYLDYEGFTVLNKCRWNEMIYIFNTDDTRRRHIVRFVLVLNLYCHTFNVIEIIFIIISFRRYNFLDKRRNVSL